MKISLMKIMLLFCIFLACTIMCLGDENINKFIFDGQNFKFIDLTLSFDEQYAKLSDGEKTRVRTRDGYNLRYDLRRDSLDFCEKEWIGTTLDLKHKYGDPMRFGVQLDKKYISNKRKNVDALPLQSLIVPLIIVDVSDKVNGDTNFILEKHHLDYFLNNYFGNTAQPCIIVFKFGWSTTHKYDIRRYYGLNDGTNVTSRIPGISEEVANWITTGYKNVIGVGVDLPAVDPDTSAYRAHNTLVDSGLYVVTNVDLELYIPDAWCTALLLPQARQGSTTSVRFVAICPKSRMERHEVPFHRL